MPTIPESAALDFDAISEYVDVVLDSHWSNRDSASNYRQEWVRRFPKRSDRTWAEEARIIVDDNTLKLDLGDGTEVRVTNPTRSMVAQFVALFESTVAERIGAIEAAAV